MKNKYTQKGRVFAFFCLLSLFSFNIFAQVGIGNTDPAASSLLDIRDTNSNTKGILIPRVDIVSLTSPAPVTSPATSLLVYNTNTTTGPGFYYWNATRWVGIDGGKNWNLSGNAGTLSGTNFLGTTDNIALQFKTRNFSRFEISSGTSQMAGGRLRAFTNGSALEPIYSWDANKGTGMYQTAANTLGFSTNTNERMRILPDGRVVVNRTAAPPTGNRFSVYGVSDEDVINGGSWGSGTAVYGYAYESGAGMHGQTPGSGYGVFAASTGTATGLTAITLGTGRAMWVQNSGTGDGMYMIVENGDGMFNNIINGTGIYNKILGAGNAGIISDLLAQGGVGELVAFGSKNGIGVNVSALSDPNDPGSSTGGDVWGLAGSVKTSTGSTGNLAYGGLVGGNQYGKGHGILINHEGSEGRNAEFNSNNPNNGDPNIFAVSMNRAPTIQAQNQSSGGGSTITVADISYTGDNIQDHIAISGSSTPPSANNYGYGIGVKGTGGYYGVHGVKVNSGTGFGVYATGNIGASGTKTFVIDDPRDSENKYLKHFSIESNEVLNLYRGTATFYADGSVSVKLPDYYDIINKNPSYQLTPLGAAMPNLYIEKEVTEGIFVIAGGVPGKRVSWILTAERNDPYMQQNPNERDVVVDKGSRRGLYLMPELYGQPKEKMIGFYESQKAEMQSMHTDAKVELRDDDKSNDAKAEVAKAMVKEVEKNEESDKEKVEKNSIVEKPEFDETASPNTKN